MRRRAFIAGLGATAWPVRASTQQADGMRRIGVLTSVLMSQAADPQSLPEVGAFLQGLQLLGWTKGRNIRIDYRRTVAGTDRAARVINRSLRQPRQSQSLCEPGVVRGTKRPDPILKV
jgi:hypothetical protein